MLNTEWQWLHVATDLVCPVNLDCDLLTYFCYSFNPSTWGYSPKDIEHVKNSCNIYKAKYVQCVKKKNNQEVYIAKEIHANFKIENTYMINTDAVQCGTG